MRLENGRVAVARILIDSVIDRQDLLRPGDVILQCNGKDVKNPEELQKAIETSASEFIVFKIRPTVDDEEDIEPSVSTVKPAKSGKGKVTSRRSY